jgi:Phosphotyrosyl phosphate activator (PTPA) protein
MTTSGYVVPTKQIVSPSDLHAFIHSNAYTLVHSFIEDLSTSVVDTPISPDIKTSEVNDCKPLADGRMLTLFSGF